MSEYLIGFLRVGGHVADTEQGAFALMINDSMDAPSLIASQHFWSLVSW